MVVFAFVNVAVAATTETEAKSAINSAQQQLIACYQAFVNADGAGANSSNSSELMRLQNVLNNASVFLSQANLAFQNKSYDEAVSLAASCQNRLNGFVNAANSLIVSASQYSFWDFALNTLASSIGAVAVVIGGFVIWAFLRRIYVRGGSVA
jgi:hypothetical protein